MSLVGSFTPTPNEESYFVRQNCRSLFGVGVYGAIFKEGIDIASRK